MKRTLPKIAIASTVLSLLACLLGACTHEPAVTVVPQQQDDLFPPAIGKILRTNCATAGCHNAASHQISGGGLLMDSWEHLFNGGNHGAAIVPYNPENSPLLYFTNSYPDLGPVPADVSMRMPLNGTPLSREDYLILRNWVAQGAPDKHGNIPFASKAATRQKIYLAHQGCDYVTVIDAEKHVIMRTVPVGKTVTIESSYDLKIGPDGTAYLSLWASDEIFKIDTKSDSVSGTIGLGMPNSNMLHLSPDGKDLLIANWYMNRLLKMDLATNQTSAVYGGSGFSAPHGIASNKAFDTFFVTEQTGNIVYKIPATGNYRTLSIDGTAPTNGSGKPDPYDIIMAPDYGRYFLSCAGSNEIRVMDARTDVLLKVIPVGTKPQRMALSREPASPYLFVSCEEDVNPGSTIYRGSVYIINYNTYEVVQRVSDRYFMPHALAVDDRSGMLYVFSRNIDPAGPPPHHNSATCEGRSGYYSIYDFKALKPLDNKRYEVTVDPFAADTRFK